MTSVTDNDNIRVAMEYNDRNEATALNWSGPQLQSARVEMERNNLGDMTGLRRYLDLAGSVSAGKTTYTFDRAPMNNGFAPAAYNAQGDADRLANLRETSSFGPLQVTPQTDDLLLPGNQPLQRIGSVTHTNQSGTQESRNDYTYDAAGQLKSETISQLPSPISTRNYAYDPTGQLTSVKDENDTTIESFDFDDSGNREEYINLNTNSIYSVGENNRYQNVTIDGFLWTFAYDEEGNLVSKASVTAGEVWFYEYDHRNRMTKAEKRPDMSSPVELSVTYTYDLFDRRIEKHVTRNAQPATRTTFAYNGDMIWSEQSAINNQQPTISYYLTGDRIDQWLGKQTLDPGPGTFDLSWFQADRLGSITGIADETGVTNVSTTYSAFGVIQDQAFIDEQEGTVLGFTGREFDEETGLYYYRARYYDPELGRFISEDPIGFGGRDHNLKRYTYNNSQGFYDPSGLSTSTDTALIRAQVFNAAKRCAAQLGLDIVEDYAINAVYLFWVEGNIYAGKSVDADIRKGQHVNNPEKVKKIAKRKFMNASDQIRNTFRSVGVIGLDPVDTDRASRQLRSIERAMQEYIDNNIGKKHSLVSRKGINKKDFLCK